MVDSHRFLCHASIRTVTQPVASHTYCNSGGCDAAAEGSDDRRVAPAECRPWPLIAHVYLLVVLPVHHGLNLAYDPVIHGRS